MREFTDREGRRWSAELIGGGRTSSYLNPRVHRPVLQFSCLDHRLPRRYLGYSEEQRGPFDDLSDRELRELLDGAKSH